MLVPQIGRIIINRIMKLWKAVSSLLLFSDTIMSQLLIRLSNKFLHESIFSCLMNLFKNELRTKLTNVFKIEKKMTSRHLSF